MITSTNRVNDKDASDVVGLDATPFLNFLMYDAFHSVSSITVTRISTYFIGEIEVEYQYTHIQQQWLMTTTAL